MENLKKLRCALKMTQAELAQEVGATQSLVAQWERGVSMPSAARLPLLANTLKCTIDDLFAGLDAEAHQAEPGAERG